MKKEKQKYEYSFINGGKPFTLEDWDVNKHKAVLKKMANIEEKYSNEGKKLSDDEKDQLFQDTLILYGLNDIDSSVTQEQLNTMHPLDKSALFNAIYYAGRKGIIAKERDDARKK
jgi:hypothetical protein